ncbi:hypothetical protein [Pelobacter propionicus]|uniref:Uncharacterized protein n=1 Tax=Pelobacter propionicus (strain DSM 2379 / NBRC 103807 / OttBd1) TaxID=338966 RepID=A1AM73_PELPD|nr:hypothetical protein [Pelobacter propionicus]ABK98443.1 hypothetical protein Ppro_0813 [Pelobacter propionicus DSM 2379]
MMGKALARWKKLSAKERLRYQLLLIAALLGIYGGGFYPISKSRLAESEKMLHRRQDRIKKRAGAVDTVVGAASSPQAIAKRIETVDAELDSLRMEFDELDSGFAPVDSTETRQQLLLEISALAERSGVELTSVARKGFSPEKDLGTPAVDPAVGRPLLLITANTTYPYLLTFLYGLRDLSFYVSVMKVKMHSRHLDEEQRKSSTPLPSGLISVSIEMSI